MHYKHVIICIRLKVSATRTRVWGPTRGEIPSLSVASLRLRDAEGTLGYPTCGVFWQRPEDKAPLGCKTLIRSQAEARVYGAKDRVVEAVFDSLNQVFAREIAPHMLNRAANQQDGEVAVALDPFIGQLIPPRSQPGLES